MRSIECGNNRLEDLSSKRNNILQSKEFAENLIMLNLFLDKVESLRLSRLENINSVDQLPSLPSTDLQSLMDQLEQEKRVHFKASDLYKKIKDNIPQNTTIELRRLFSNLKDRVIRSSEIILKWYDPMKTRIIDEKFEKFLEQNIKLT